MRAWMHLKSFCLSSLRSWWDFARECFCWRERKWRSRGRIGEEFTRGFAARKFLAGFARDGIRRFWLSPTLASRQLRRLLFNMMGIEKMVGESSFNMTRGGGDEDIEGGSENFYTSEGGGLLKCQALSFKIFIPQPPPPPPLSYLMNFP